MHCPTQHACQQLSFEVLPGPVHPPYQTSFLQCFKLKISRGVATPGQARVACHFDLSPLISQTCVVVDGHRKQPQSTLNKPIPDHPMPQLQREFDSSDSSRPLFSMYCKIAEEEDNKMVERCQSDSVGILIFVSPHFNRSMNPHINQKHRLVYSLPLLVHCLRSQSPTSSQIHKTPPHSTYGTSIKSLATQTFLHRSRLLLQNHLHSLPQNMPSG